MGIYHFKWYKNHFSSLYGIHHLVSNFDVRIIILFSLCTCILLLTSNPFLYQMGAVEMSFDEVQNIFDTGGAKGLSGDSVEKIPKITITSDNNVDASGERVSCSVCLQVCL